MQLDDRALFLERWQRLLAGLVDARAVDGHPRRAELRALLPSWSGHAAVGDAAYRVVRAFRAEVERRVFFALIAPARAILFIFQHLKRERPSQVYPALPTAP